MSMDQEKQIGIVGGGISSLMLCIEAAKMGIRTCLLDPKVDCIGARVATEHIVGTITKENVKKMSLRCDAMIYNTKPAFEIDIKLHTTMYPYKEQINELYRFKNIMDILELLEIPTGKIFYQENNQDTFKELEHLEMPFRFIKQYQRDVKQLDIFSKEDLKDFMMEMDEEAESFVLQPLAEYKQVIACICLVDEKGKIYQYYPIEERTEDQNIYILSIGDSLSKSMCSKLARYNRKLLKEIQGVGAFTIKYGVKSNKSVEFIEITPELGAGSLLTLEAYDRSIYEQYIRMVLGMKVVAPERLYNAYGIVEASETTLDKDKIGKLYRCGFIDVYTYRDKIEE